MLIVDTREPAYFKEKADVVDTLSAGDYIVQGNRNGQLEVHVIERKEASDFFSTLFHRNRKVKEALWRQLDALCEYRDMGYHVYLLLEGDVGKELRIHKIPLVAYAGIQRAITVGYHMPIIHTLNMGHTWMFLESLNRSLEEPREYVRPPPVRKKNRSLAECQEDVICSAVDKLGRKKAQALLRHFGSVHAVVNASVEELMQVNGIGEKTARPLYEVLRASYNPNQEGGECG